MRIILFTLLLTAPVAGRTGPPPSADPRIDGIVRAVSATCGGCLEVRYASERYPAGQRRLHPDRETTVVNVPAIQRGADGNESVIVFPRRQRRDEGC